jgi:hypothetical protein
MYLKARAGEPWSSRAAVITLAVLPLLISAVSFAALLLWLFLSKLFPVI